MTPTICVDVNEGCFTLTIASSSYMNSEMALQSQTMGQSVLIFKLLGFLIEHWSYPYHYLPIYVPNSQT